MRRTREDAQQTREEIFHAGVEVFAHKGYAAATMGDIAAKAGVTRGAIYWHFKNKEAFFTETLSRLHSAYDEMIQLVMDADDEPLEAISLTVKTLITKYVRDRDFRTMQELVIRASVSHPELRDGNFPQQPNGNDDTAETFLTAAITSGQIYRDWHADTALHAIAAVVMGLFSLISTFNLKLDDQEITELTQFIQRGFKPQTMRDPQIEEGYHIDPSENAYLLEEIS